MVHWIFSPLCDDQCAETSAASSFLSSGVSMMFDTSSRRLLAGPLCDKCMGSRSKCTKCILEITETKSQETQRPRKPHLPDHNGCSSKSVKTAFYPLLSLFTIMETIPGNKCCCIRRSDILMVNLEVLFATLLEKLF